LKSEAETVSEGAGFFVVSNEKNENCLGKISNVETAFEVENEEEFILNFLGENEISAENLDAVILGNNGDSRYDAVYENLSGTIFRNLPQIAYKNVVGEFDTVTSLAVDLGLKIFQNQRIPDILKLNDLKSENYQKILIYNQRRGKNHSLILLENEL
jgi:hypothetical protein